MRTRGGKTILAVAAFSCVLMAMPAMALSATSLALSVEPAIPGKNKSFQVRATGVADSPTEDIAMSVVLNPGLQPCSSTGSLEAAKVEEDTTDTAGYWFTSFLGGNTPENVPFDEFRVFDGRPVGHYRLCGYLEEQKESGRLLASARLEFSIGGTCASSTAKVAKADAKLKSAKTKLASAQASGVKARINAARGQVKKARAKLKVAKEDRKALC
jgi:hypothetical protein